MPGVEREGERGKGIVEGMGWRGERERGGVRVLAVYRCIHRWMKMLVG